jgi:hypothetical protein
MTARLVAALIAVGLFATWVIWHLGRAVGNWRARSHRGGTPGHAALVVEPIDEAMIAGGNRGDPGVGRSRSALVEAWAEGRTCVLCGGPVAESRLHHIALLEPAGMTREWIDIADDRLPLALATCLPVCWNCHLAETFRRMHPELITDREETAVRTHH